MIESITLSLKSRSLASNSFDSALVESCSQSKLGQSKFDSGNMVRKVRFYPRVLMQETLHINDYSPYEVATSWYSRSELMKLKYDLKEILVDNPRFLSTDSEYNRALYHGLEGYTQHGSKQRRQNRRAGLSAVLRNFRFSETDDEYHSKIAQSYRLATESSVLQAIERGVIRDEQSTTQKNQSPMAQPKEQSNLAKNIPAWILSPSTQSVQRLFRIISCH
jgi:hypothetical protein